MIPRNASSKASAAAPRARRRPVPHEPLAAFQRSDYADAFEVRSTARDDRNPEQFARAALEGAPRWLRATIRVAQRYVLLLRLAPASDPEHVLGWRIATSTDDAVVLEAHGPLLRALLVGRRLDDSARTLSTFLAYRQPVTKQLWMLVGPIHRWVAPRLLERAAVLGQR